MADEPTTETTDEPVTEPDDVVDSPAETDADPEGSDALGDAGKKALDAMKAKWRAERDKRRELEAKISGKPAEGETTDAPDAEAIRREVLRDANARILRSEVKAAAVGKLADPSDAYKFLDLSAFEVDDNGEVDADEIADAIQDLITAKPYLAAATAKRFQGSGDGGAARKASGPAQLTRADVAKMSPEQIIAAKKEGRLKNLLSGKD